MEQYSFYVSKSRIHGNRLFTNNWIKPYQKLFKVTDNKDNNLIISRLGKLVNHCNKPNTKLVQLEDGWYLYSISFILPENELVANYSDTPSFISKPNPQWTC